MFGLLAASSWAQDLGRTPCIQDGDIGELEPRINSAAMNFVDALFRGDSASAFSDLSRDLRLKLGSEGLAEKIRTIQQFEPTNATVQHTYLIRVGEHPVDHVVCASKLLAPSQWVSLNITNVPEQAHVLMSADAPNNRLAVTVWILRENNEWKVRGFWVNVAALAGQDSAKLWENARQQKQRMHSFNAALLYVAALQLVNRGPDLQMGIAQIITEDMNHTVAPPELQGPPPFSWRDGDKSWKILSVGPMAVGGKVYVAISHEVPEIQTDSEVDGWNKELLTYFKNRFPEYSDVFAGVVIRAHERGTNRKFGTVEQLGAPK
ncbi:MAG: hypothetical protein LAO55_17355 [Acidobacteriia bacterium]|nr:hypothetical protein [Terriglobia bacterium]